MVSLLRQDSELPLFVMRQGFLRLYTGFWEKYDAQRVKEHFLILVLQTV